MTTIKVYASKDAGDLEAARVRCEKKYGKKARDLFKKKGYYNRRNRRNVKTTTQK